MCAQAKEEYFEILYKRDKEASRKGKTVIIVIRKDFPSFIAAAGYMTISVGILNPKGRAIPDGHLKIPHLWPGQNPPPQGRQNGW